MQKRFALFFLIASFIFFSCEDGTNSDSSKNDENKSDTVGTYVTIKNKTGGTLEVFEDSTRYTLLGKIAAGEDGKFETSFSGGEQVFYLSYHVDIGLDVPFYDNSSYIVFTSDGDAEKSVSLPSSMDISSAYLVLENNSSDESCQIELMRGSANLIPSGKTSTLLDFGNSAVYEIKKSYFLNYSSFYIDCGDEEYPLPDAVSYFEKDVIYTMSFTGVSLELLAKTPFSTDAKNKIWSRKSYYVSSANKFVTHVFRSRYNRQNGSMVAGVLATNSVENAKIIFLDEYGNTVSDAEISVTDSDGKVAQSYLFYDLIETSAGDFVALIHVFFSDSASAIYLISWDSTLKTCNWLYQINQNLADYLFCVNTKGKIEEIDANTFAVCGSCNNAPFIERVYYDSAENTVTATNMMIESAEITGSESDSGAENIFTSMIYDGTDFILTGYANFDGDYTKSSPHTGFVLKISSDLEIYETLYQKEKCLFYGIDLDSDGNYYICGELADNGNALHGCFASSAMMQKGDEPLVFNGSATHTWFTQICVEENRVTFSGETSSDTSGSDSVALILSVNKSGGEMWKSEFSDYSTVYSCMENAIGSFFVELYDSVTQKSKIVSTDLLGNDTGMEYEVFGNE
jgi:hypothetical protein